MVLHDYLNKYLSVVLDSSSNSACGDFNCSSTVGGALIVQVLLVVFFFQVLLVFLIAQVLSVVLHDYLGASGLPASRGIYAFHGKI